MKTVAKISRLLPPAVSLALWCALPAFAQHDVAADDPEHEQPLEELFYTDPVYPQEAREVQITLALAGDRHSIEAPVELEYGITDSWQVSVECQAYASSSLANRAIVPGSGSVEIGTQRSFLNIRGTEFHAAIGSSLEIPRTHPLSAEGESSVELQPYAIFARDFPALGNLQLAGTVGIPIPFESDELGSEDPRTAEEARVDLDFAAFLPLGNVVLAMELTGIGSEEMYLVPGSVLRLSGRWELGIPAALGLTEASDELRFLLVVTHEF